MPKLAVIDLGFLYTKAKVNHKDFMMKSVVGNSRTLNFGDLRMGSQPVDKDHLVSSLEGEDYFVSDLAIDQSDSVIHSLKTKRFDSSATQVLMNTVFGLGFGSGSHVSYAVSGLPVSHYADFKEEIKKLFMGEGTGGKTHQYRVKTDSSTYEGSLRLLDSRFVPQPFGALIDVTCDNSGAISNMEYAGKTVAIVDIGFGTTDVFVANQLNPVEKLSFSTQTAMNHAYRMISNRIQESFEVSLPLYGVEALVKSGKFHTHGKSYSMTPTINWAYQLTAEQLVSEIQNKWKTMHEIDYIILAGGGSLGLADYILPEFQNASLAPGGQQAVVRGYWKWGLRTWKDVF